MWLLFRSDYFIVVNRFAYRRIGQTAGAAIVISDQGTHALLVKQTEDPYPNWWLPPAGYCKHEDGKAPEDSSTTAKRRFAELTGKGDVSTVRIAQTKGRSYAELCIRYGHLPIPVTVHRLTSSSTLSPATIQEDSMHRWVCLSDLRDDRFRVPEYYNEIMIAIMEGKGLTALRYWDVDPDYR